MPNTNNTPFTWTDAQWLNTQVTNCVERSTQAVATAAQALALLNNSNIGTKLLSKTIGVNLNPTLTLTYTSLVNTFTAGATITDANGSTALILTDNGTNSMTLTNVVFESGSGLNTLGGTITESGGTATAAAGSMVWEDQVINLTGGNTFIITDIVITNVSAAPSYASDIEWWGGPNRTGSEYAQNNNLSIRIGGSGGLTGFGGGGSADDGVLPLANPNQYMSIMNGQIAFIQQGPGNSLSTCGNVLYFTVGVPEGAPLTCDMYVYGYILN